MSRTTARTAPWWRSAPNPSCASFCDRDHEADAFTHGGGMLCTTVVARGPGFVLEIQQSIDAEDAPGEVERSRATIYYNEVRSDVEFEELTAQAARDFGYGLAQALSKAARRLDEVNGA